MDPGERLPPESRVAGRRASPDSGQREPVEPSAETLIDRYGVARAAGERAGAAVLEPRADRECPGQSPQGGDRCLACASGHGSAPRGGRLWDGVFLFQLLEALPPRHTEDRSL